MAESGWEAAGMVLDWFGRSKQASVSELISRKHYARAVEAIKAELQKRRKDRRLRLQLGEVFVLAGRPAEAVKIWNALADDLALEGRVAQSIAVLKRIQAVAPGGEVAEKLVYLIKQETRPSEDPWSTSRRRASSGFILPESEAMGGAAEIGMEELAAGGARVEIGMEEGPADAGVDAAPASGEGGLDLEAPASAAEASGDLGLEPAVLSDDAVRDEIVALLEEVFRPAVDDDGAAPGGEPAPLEGVLSEDGRPVRTPLFDRLSSEELTALIAGLKLVTMAPGEIIITEGEPQGSLFVITSGRARAYVRHTSGRSLPIRELREGDFFGEASVLLGSPRTATVTAATSCELLELDRPSLEAVCGTHPHVREVLQQFHDQRAGNTLEAAIRTMELG